MVIIKEKTMSKENSPAIKTTSGEWWFVDGKLHRSKKPAVICGGTKIYFWRGIFLTERMALGEMSPSEILKIENIAQRQSSMEIAGYNKFLSSAMKIDSKTPKMFSEKYPEKTTPMYTLYVLKNEQDEGEVIKILLMRDPSLGITYPIRVAPPEVDCLEAVAHSYGFKSWEEYEKVETNWV